MPADNSTPLTEEEIIQQCVYNFYLVATLQGRISYFLMSIHAVNPTIITYFSSYNPTPFLFFNMLYGIGVDIFSRPAMGMINPINRFMFSALGSMMFNYSTMLVYNWLVENLSHRPYLLTFLGFLSGRLMMVHFLAYLYHVDSRVSPSNYGRRNSAFETMYI